MGDGTMKRKACLFGILMCMTALPIRAGDRISMRISPAVAFAPATLIVRASIEADAHNRIVTIVAESDDFYRSSDIQLEGDQAPRTSTLEFRSLPPGVYQIRATLFGSDGQSRGYVHQEINIMSSGPGQ
jgi:hypothetical protein